jgi:hypothetical protein
MHQMVQATACIWDHNTCGTCHPHTQIRAISGICIIQPVVLTFTVYNKILNVCIKQPTSCMFDNALLVHAARCNSPASYTLQYATTRLLVGCSNNSIQPNIQRSSNREYGCFLHYAAVCTNPVGQTWLYNGSYNVNAT